MATYRYHTAPNELLLEGRVIYGSSRLGIDGAKATPLNDPAFNPSGVIQYELTDHLGNVTVTVTDELVAVDEGQDSDPANDYNGPVIVSAQGYEVFGSLLPGRNYFPGSYRYLFQGQEHDDEIIDGVGTSYSFEYRIHDARVGRFLSIDPLAAKYPFYTPYQFAGNTPLIGPDVEGLENPNNPNSVEDTDLENRGKSMFSTEQEMTLSSGNGVNILVREVPNGGGILRGPAKDGDFRQVVNSVSFPSNQNSVATDVLELMNVLSSGKYGSAADAARGESRYISQVTERDVSSQASFSPDGRTLTIVQRVVTTEVTIGGDWHDKIVNRTRTTLTVTRTYEVVSRAEGVGSLLLFQNVVECSTTEACDDFKLSDDALANRVVRALAYNSKEVERLWGRASKSFEQIPGQLEQFGNSGRR